MGEANKPSKANADERERLITEVLELGEDLFDLALTRGVNGEQLVGGEEVGAVESDVEGENADKGEVEDGGDDFPVADLRAAADEFFVALRLLLG